MNDNMTNNVSDSFKSLSHPIRVQILLILAGRNDKINFSRISRELQIESSSKLSFHMDKLEQLVDRDEDGRYYLNDQGRRAVDAIRMLGIGEEDPDAIAKELEGQYPSKSVKIQNVGEEEDTTLTGSNGISNSYGVVFGGSLMFLLFLVLGLPFTLILMNSRLVAVGALLAIVFVFFNGMFLYKIASLQEGDAVEDLPIMIISIAGLFISNSLPVGDTIPTVASLAGIVGGILIILFMSAGIYITAELCPDPRWDDMQVLPPALGHRAVIGSFIVFLVAYYPFVNQTVSLPAQGSIVRLIMVNSAVVGAAGLRGFFLVLFLCSLLLIIPHLRRFAEWIYAVVALIVVLYVWVFLRTKYGDFLVIVEQEPVNGGMWLTFQILSWIFFIWGAVLGGLVISGHYKLSQS